MNANTTCPVCDVQDNSVFVRRRDVPAHQNAVFETPRAAQEARRGDLAMAACNSCGFVWNQDFDLSRLSYDETYDNTQTYSPFFTAHVESLVRYLVEERGARNCHIVEVGCGKGLFLRRLIETDNSNIGYGFDPTYEGPLDDLDGRLRFRKSFYDESCAGIPADIVVCRHVIEHVPQPLQLLRAIRGALAQSDHGRVFFETPCIEWILRHRTFWDFFYEHCSIFSTASLSTAFERAGFEVENVRHVFGGQYLWLEARTSASSDASPSAGEIPVLAQAFEREEARLREAWEKKARELAARGRIAVWGAGAKGVTFVNLLDPERQLFDCVVDLNERKQNRFLAGTAHPIVSPHDLAARGVTSAISTNPNYRDENLRLLRELKSNVELIEIDAL